MAAAMDATALGGHGGCQGLVVVPGRSSEGVNRCVRTRSSLIDGKGCNSEELMALGARRFWILSRDGERMNEWMSSAGGAGVLGKMAFTKKLPSMVNEARWGFVIEKKVTGAELEQFSVLRSAAYVQNFHQGWRGRCHRSSSLSRQHEGSQQASFISIPMEETVRVSLPKVRVCDRGEESILRTGRRAFTSILLLGLATFIASGETSEVLAEETQAKTKGRVPSSPYDEDRLLEQNRRMQRLNNAPTEFPGFVREGFQVKVIINDKYVTSKSGLIYYDMVVGEGDLPQDGQQVIFHYTGYNESGRRVDSSYQQGRPARTRLGIQGMIPGFEEGIKSMRAGGRRIIIVPPELGPPVGPSTFFSAKQFEVFDVELLESKDCSRRTLLFYSDVVCD